MAHTALPVFTRAFPHPLDKGSRVSDAAIQRFRKDQARFPVHQYEQKALLWKESCWRTPSAAERAAIMGVPPSMLEAATAPEPLLRGATEDLRCSLVGNGFHIPSLMLVIVLSCALLPARAKPSQPLYDIWESRL